MKKAYLLVMLFISLAQANFAATSVPKSATDSVYICQSRSAYAYHKTACSGLARCTHTISKITKAQAIKLGYKPCKICY